MAQQEEINRSDTENINGSRPVGEDGASPSCSSRLCHLHDDCDVSDRDDTGCVPLFYDVVFKVATWLPVRLGLLLVVLDDVFIARFGFFGVESKFSAGAALSQKVPTLVQFD